SRRSSTPWRACAGASNAPPRIRATGSRRRTSTPARSPSAIRCSGRRFRARRRQPRRSGRRSGDPRRLRAGATVASADRFGETATRRGIVVANAPESNVVSAAEHTVGLLVALARNIPQAHAALVGGRWERSKWGGVELAEKTLGILGFGRIGQQVARRAIGLQMRVGAYDPSV